jgi:hypothetical protein
MEMIGFIFALSVSRDLPRVAIENSITSACQAFAG